VAHGQPGTECHDGAQGGLGVVGPDGDLLAGAALVGLGAAHQHAQPAARDGCCVAKAECHQLGAPQGGGEAQQQQGAVAQAERAGRGRAGGEHPPQHCGHGGGGLAPRPGASAAHDALDDHGQAGIAGVERDACEPMGGEDGGEVDAQAGDTEPAVGAVHGIHGQQPGVAGEGGTAEACAPGLVGAPCGAVGAQGAGAAGAGGVAGGALVQVLQGAGERPGEAVRVWRGQDQGCGRGRARFEQGRALPVGGVIGGAVRVVRVRAPFVAAPCSV